MSPVEALREFIIVRLTAAAGEIFNQFQQTLVQYQEEVQTQHRLLDINRTEPTKSPTTDNSWKYSCIEEQLWNKQRNCRLEKPEHPEIKDEPSEPEPPQDKDGQVHLEVKQEAVTIMVTVTDEESENGTNVNSHDSVREFINVQLTAAAAKIFTLFQQTFVQYQEEIDSQHRLLHDTWNPQTKLHRRDVPEHRVYTDQQLWNQEMSSGLDQEPKPTRIKEEEEELCTSLEGEMLLKQEVGCIVMNSTGEPSEPAPDGQLLLSQDVVSPQSQHEKNGQVIDLRLTEQSELEPQQRSYSEDPDDSLLTEQSFLSLNMTTQTGERSHTCPICGKGFIRNQHLLDHMRTHSDERPYSCVKCGKHFKLKSTLSVHMRTHTGEKPHPCLTCGKRFRRSCHLSEHMKSHSDERPYPCVRCGKRFKIRSTLVAHIRTHTNERPFSCETCGKSFSQKTHLSEHIKIHTGERPHSCVTCGKRFIGKGEMLAHIRLHTGEKPYSCELCGKSFRRNSQLTEHMRLHTGERRYSCEMCGKRFFKSRDVAAHKKKNHSELWNQEMIVRLEQEKSPSQIKEEELSTTVEGLKQEIDTIMIISPGESSEPEPDGEPFLSHDFVTTGSQHPREGHIVDLGSSKQSEQRSDKSGRRENVNSSLLTSERFLSVNMKTPTAQKSEFCVICGKVFSQESSLLVHMRTHTDERPYSCVHCGKRFKVKSTLSAHERTHTGERPFSCQTCGKSFSQKAHLSEHNKIHTGERPHCCVACGKRFIFKADMLAHIRVHTGERPYTCETCGKGFRRQSYLTEHIRFHTGERRYSCVLCGQRFFKNRDLMVHKRKYHREEPNSCVT